MTTTRCTLAPVLLAFAALLAWTLPAAPGARAQAMPEGVTELPAWTCPERDRGDAPDPATLGAEERAERERRAHYRAVFPAYVEAVGDEPDARLPVPVDGVRVGNVTDTWGAPRGGGRRHQGQDLFAPAGTPVRSVVTGYVWRIGERGIGGHTVTVIGDGARRYYYAHLSGYADIREGQRVTPDTALGYVGATGNASTTPPHLHFGIYDSWEGGEPCGWSAIDPLPLLVDR